MEQCSLQAERATVAAGQGQNESTFTVVMLSKLLLGTGLGSVPEAASRLMLQTVGAPGRQTGL